MKISYVLPVYNSQNTIARSIKSILSQEIPPHELIVINDGSTDHTGDILAHFNKDITLITNSERQGAAKCRNRGNSLSTGDVIAVCDADMYYKKRSVAISDVFKGEIDVFYSALHLRDASNTVENYKQEAYIWDFKSKCPISHPTVAYRKKVADKIRYKELTRESDLYEFFLLDAHKAGFKIDGDNTPLMLKIENDQKRLKKESNKIKVKLYKEYGIKIRKEQMI